MASPCWSGSSSIGRSARRSRWQPVLSGEELKALAALSRRIYLPDVVTNYIARLVDATHGGEAGAARGVKFGASPRAALALAAAARARALLAGRMNASFEDVRALAAPVLQHRLVLDYTRAAGGAPRAGCDPSLLEHVPGAGVRAAEDPARREDLARRCARSSPAALARASARGRPFSLRRGGRVRARRSAIRSRARAAGDQDHLAFRSCSRRAAMRRSKC